MTVRFVPDRQPPLLVTEYGTRCGATLVVNDTRSATMHDILMTTIGGFADAPVLLLFGGDRDSMPIAGSQCLLLVEPIAALGLIANAGGFASWRAQLPAPLRSARFVVQAIPIDAANGIRATQGIELRFVD